MEEKKADRFFLLFCCLDFKRNIPQFAHLWGQTKNPSQTESVRDKDMKGIDEKKKPYLITFTELNVVIGVLLCTFQIVKVSIIECVIKL